MRCAAMCHGWQQYFAAWKVRWPIVDLKVLVSFGTCNWGALYTFYTQAGGKEDSENHCTTCELIL